MHAVVSLFEKKEDKLVRSLWSELQHSFHIRGVYKTPYPHFSYHIASRYNFPKLEAELHRFAKGSVEFTVHASGLGVFTGRKPVLYIPIVRSSNLSQFHLSLWRRIAPLGYGVPPYYEGGRWLPHVTLAQWDIDERNLPRIVGKLSKRRIELDLKVNNLALVFDDGTTQTVRSIFPFPH